MKRVSFVFVIMTFSLLIVTTFGCTYFSPIVGKWKDNKSQDITEFTRDGNVIVESGGHFFTGKYELIGDNIVKFNFEGLAGDMLSLSGADTWQYEISGDTMTINIAGDTSVLYRYGNTDSQPNTTNETIAISQSQQITTTIPTQHKFNIGDKFVNTNWTDDTYLLIVDIVVMDGELYYVTWSNGNELSNGFASVSNIDNDPRYQLID